MHWSVLNMTRSQRRTEQKTTHPSSDTVQVLVSKLLEPDASVVVKDGNSLSVLHEALNSP